MTSGHDLDIHRALLETSKGLEALAGAMEALQADSKSTEVDQARINTRLEDMLTQLHGLVRSVRGDQGLMYRVAVLETELKNLQSQLQEHRVSLQKALDDKLPPLREDVEDLRKTLNTRVKEELDEAKGEIRGSKNYRIAVASALIAALALTAGVAKDCISWQPKAVSSSPG